MPAPGLEAVGVSNKPSSHKENSSPIAQQSSRVTSITELLATVIEKSILAVPSIVSTIELVHPKPPERPVVGSTMTEAFAWVNAISTSKTVVFKDINNFFMFFPQFYTLQYFFIFKEFIRYCVTAKASFKLSKYRAKLRKWLKAYIV